MVVCDTCGQETDKVYRVVVDKGYDRSGAAPVYNCRACFERKNAERGAEVPVEPGVAPTRPEGEVRRG